MKDELAESLLAQVLKWSEEEKARERAVLQDFARYKHDEYQQFSPGRRFIESLALWLRQFDTVPERRVAYEFARSRLIFVSNSEMQHLVRLAFATCIRPRLIEAAGVVGGIEQTRPKSVLNSKAYRIELRRTLFLGLTDGACTDVFRRANASISNEQIWHAYDISDTKAEDMQHELKADLGALLEPEPVEERPRGLPQNLWAEWRTGSPSSDPQRARVLAAVKARRSAPPPLRGADGLDAGSAHAGPGSCGSPERGVGGLRPVRGAPG